MAKRRSKTQQMSPELKAMLSRPRNAPSVQGPNLGLERAANKILGRAGFFPKREEHEADHAVEADAIGVRGLRPTWVGRP